MGIIVVYPLNEGDAYFIALTQPGPPKKYPIDFVARYLTNIELDYGMIAAVASIAAWEIRKLHCYTIFSMEVHIILPTTADVQLVVDIESNGRLRAYIIDLK